MTNGAEPEASQRQDSRRAGAGLRYDLAWQQSAWRSRLRRRLLGWFDEAARDLPWRRDPDPYKVWISEIMCQQTQVATVLPYFERFLKSFPTTESLASADEQHLMKHWEGLGYYRRARSLHAAAKQIVQHHGGKFPSNVDDVLQLPGIGRYTAGAILSISADQRLPILEGNTQRVFSRWMALRMPPTDPAANRLLWHFAETMLPRRGSGAFNQAAMELGALVCTPRQPKCSGCPVRSSCAARREGIEETIPGKLNRPQYEDRTEFALVVGDSHRGYLMRPLPDGGRWGGLWDFPRTHEHLVESSDAAAEWLTGQIGTPVEAGARLKTFRHAVTKFRIRLHVHGARLQPSADRTTETSRRTPVRRPDHDPPPPWRFVKLDAVTELPLSVTGRKIADFLAHTDQQLLPLQS